MGDIKQMEKVQVGKTRTRVLIHRSKMTIGELEPSVSPEDRNSRNPVPDGTCFILTRPSACLLATRSESNKKKVV